METRVFKISYVYITKTNFIDNINNNTKYINLENIFLSILFLF